MCMNVQYIMKKTNKEWLRATKSFKKVLALSSTVFCPLLLQDERKQNNFPKMCIINAEYCLKQFFWLYFLR
jgi:hypothetical protein